MQRFLLWQHSLLLQLRIVADKFRSRQQCWAWNAHVLALASWQHVAATRSPPPVRLPSLVLISSDCLCFGYPDVLTGGCPKSQVCESWVLSPQSWDLTLWRGLVCEWMPGYLCTAIAQCRPLSGHPPPIPFPPPQKKKKTPNPLTNESNPVPRTLKQKSYFFCFWFFLKV